MDYKSYLERNFSSNTIEAYIRDKYLFEKFLGLKKINEVNKSDILKYIIHLRERGYSENSITRKIASLRNYFYFALNIGEIKVDPTFDMELPKIKYNRPKNRLDEDIIRRMIEIPLELYGENLKGLRDRFLLELIYETGINISDILEKEITDLNIEIGYIIDNDEYIKLNKDLIYYGKKYKELLIEKFPENIFLFVNLQGNILTRQGLWKIFKNYSNEIDIELNIKPQEFLNSSKTNGR